LGYIRGIEELKLEKIATYCGKLSGGTKTFVFIKLKKQQECLLPVY